MTNKKAMEVWAEVLAKYCHCYADELGNRPCDYGCPCDKCMGKDVQELYEIRLQEVK